MKKSSIFIIAVVILLSALVIIFKLPAEILGRVEKVTSSPIDYGSNQIVVFADERVFTLFAALNAAGFDREYPGMLMSPVRQQVREALSGKTLPSLEKLKLFFDRIPDYQLVVWILQRGNPPAFNRAEPGWWVNNRASRFYGLADSLSDFYTEANIHDLWQTLDDNFQSEINHLTPISNQSIADIQNYLKNDYLPFKQIVIIPNPLDAYYSGTGPQINETAFVIAGPTETDLSLAGLIEHETLHSVIGPMLDKNNKIISSMVSKELYEVLKDSMPSGYGSWESILEESIIRAINLRMISDEKMRMSQLDFLESNGFLLIKTIDQELALYEQNGEAFEIYLPVLLKQIEKVKLN